MNMFEEARALYGTIKMCGVTQEEIAKKLSVSQSYVANKLRLLKFSARMQEKSLNTAFASGLRAHFCVSKTNGCRKMRSHKWPRGI